MYLNGLCISDKLVSPRRPPSHADVFDEPEWILQRFLSDSALSLNIFFGLYNSLLKWYFDEEPKHVFILKTLVKH